MYLDEPSEKYSEELDEASYSYLHDPGVYVFISLLALT